MDLMFEGLSIPDVFMNLLEEDEQSFGYFKMLPEEEKLRLIRYIDEAKTGEQARERIDEVKELAQNYHKMY